MKSPCPGKTWDNERNLDNCKAENIIVENGRAWGVVGGIRRSYFNWFPICPREPEGRGGSELTLKLINARKHGRDIDHVSGA